MGTGTTSYKNLPEQKKVFGNKDFFITPLILGLEEQYNAFVVRPYNTNDDSGFNVCIEGEFSIGAENFKEAKEEYQDEIVKFVYFKNELKDFPQDIQKEIVSYCNFSI